jgi:hypothetical protein
LYSYLFNSTASGGPGWGEIESSHYVNAASKGYLPNRAIKWETSLNRSVALDISLFNDRLTITPEVYQNSVRDLLYPANIPSTFGYTQQMQNIAEVTSRGWDLNIEGTILQGQDYYLQANFNVGYNQRTIDKLNGSDRELPEFHDKWSSEWKSDYMFRVGEDVGLIYGLVFDGLYTYDEFNMNTSGGFTWEDRKDPDLVDARGVFGVEPGMPKFKNFSDFKSGPDDYNVIDQNDRVVIGDTTPKANGGFGFSGGWKNWDFSANFTFMLDFDVVNATRYELSSLQSNELNFFNVTTDFSGDKRWRYIGDDAVALTPSQLQEVNAGKTLWHPRVINKKFLFDSFVEDGSFLRAQDITLGYTLPQELTRKVRIERLRFYASAYNLFILTKYTGYDPEVDILSGLTPNMDINKYPRSRNFVFGVNLTF